MKMPSSTQLQRVKRYVAQLLQARVGQMQRWAQPRVSRLRRWWLRGYRVYGYRWLLGTRAAAVIVIGIMVGGLVAPVANYFYGQSRYQLSDSVQHLVGKSNPRLVKQITYDKQTDVYQFNKAAVTSSAAPATTQRATAGTPDGKNSATFAVDMPTSLSQGITYHETNAQLSFSMVPKFGAADGRNVKGQMVYPLANGASAIYTLKGNGLKEDIVLDEATSDTMSFDYSLVLPKTLVAHMIDGTGNVGIYSVDPSILGDVSTSSASDAAAVQTARETGEKTHLLFAIPAPVVKSAGGTRTSAKAHFNLVGTNLTVEASGLKGLKGPISIDPSVVVTSTSDLQLGGNSDGNIDFSTVGQVNRGAITGGSFGAWTTNTDTGTVPPGHQVHMSAVYNGYFYIAGGQGLGTSSYYAPLQANGSLGAWATATSIPYQRYYGGMQAYNGYLYLYGGYNATLAVSTGDVIFAKIAADGSLGPWTTSANAMAANECRFGSAVYNGYLYALGGTTIIANGCGNSGTPTTTSQFAPILANGDVGAWTASANPFSTARMSPTTAAYNGYLYLMEGTPDGGTSLKDIQWAPLLANGDFGTWQTTTVIPGSSGDYRHAMTVYNGYIYVGTGNNYPTSMFYAPINANGTIGIWAQGPSISGGRYAATFNAYNGYLYINGGTSAQTDTQYAKIDPPGQVNPWGTLSNNFTTARALGCSVAYNNTLYLVGGSTDDSGANNVATTAYSNLNSNGTNGSWTASTALPEARGSLACVAYNGYIYALGGFIGSSSISALVRYAPLNASTGAIGTWVTTAPSMPTANTYQGAFVHATSSGTYLYVIGGSASGGASQTSVYIAPLDLSSGQVGTWITSSNTLSQSWSSRAYAQVGKYLYAFGGSNLSTTITAQTEFTSINEDGSVNPWTATTPMNTAIGYTHGTSINGCIYQVGGENATGTSLSTVQYACPAANGTISAWINAPSLTSATTDAGVAGANGYLYIVGGYTTAVTTATQYAYVNNGGSSGTGTWTTNATDLSTPYASGWGYGRAFAANGYLYIVGGYDGTTTYATVWSAPISVTGSLGSWTSTASMVTARYAFGLAVYGGYVYVAGGKTAAGFSATVESAQILPGGTLGPWASSTVGGSGVAAITTGRQFVSMAANNGYLYIAGGDNGSNLGDVQYAAVTNGGVGTWTQLTGTSSFTGARYGAGLAVANGYLYVLGGTTASNTYNNDVQYAPLNTDGSITAGAWKYTTGLLLYERYLSVAVYNGFLTIISSGNSRVTGTGGAISIVRQQTAIVRPDGTLGSWSYGPTITSSSNYQVATVITGGNVYRIGGFDGTNYYKDIQYAPIATQPRVALYSKLVDLGSAENLSGITYNGAGAGTGGAGNAVFKTAGADGVLTTVVPSALTSSTCNSTSGSNGVRFVTGSFSLDDSQNAVYPDTPSLSANLADFTVSYVQGHPLLTQRLRMGANVTSGGD